MKKTGLILFLFLVISLIKFSIFLLLATYGYLRPYVGENGRDHYIPIAERLLAEGRFNGPESRPDSKVGPGYPAILALTKKYCSNSFLNSVVGLQILGDFVLACLVYGLGSLINSSKAGLLAGFVWLLYPPAVAVSGWITAETIYSALLLLSIALLVKSMQVDRLFLSFGAGMQLGVATLFRGTCLWLPIFFLPLWISRASSRGWLKGAFFTLGILCVVFPWTLRNYIVLQDPIIVSVGFGSVFLQGSDERFFTIQGKSSQYPEMFAEAQKGGLEKPTSQMESAIDKWIFKVGFRNYENRLRERPLSFIPFALHKLVRLWYGTESGNLTDQISLGFCSLFIVPLGFWQIWHWRGNHPLLFRLFGLLVLYFIGLHWVSLPEYRYLHPVIPVLLLGACQALVTWIERRRK